MEKVQNERDRIGSTGERPIRADILNEQPVSPNDEGIVSVNPSSDAVIIGPSSNVTEQTKSSDTGQGPGSGPPIADFALQEQSATQTAYGSFTGTWDGYPQYLNIDGSHVISPVMYDDRSLVFHSGYGFNPEFAYGQYSPVATPMPSVMVDGQLYSPQQVPFSPSYYPQPAPPNLSQRSSAVPVQPTELIRPEIGNTENMLFGPGSGYLVNYGSLSGANFSGNLNSSPVTSHALYPQPIGILGSYEHSAGQISQQQRESHGYGLVPNSHYPSGTSYQRFSSRGASIPYPVANSQNQFTLDKGRRRDRDRDSNSMSNDVRDVMSEHNRGPRASRLKQKSASEQGHSSSSSKNGSSIEISLDLYNRTDFVTDYECAKFFVIKSFSEDNIHRSIKYNVWASTPHGNKKLDAAYHEAKGTKESFPVFLFFSVNGSGQFCGIAEMVGPVDFEKDAEYWQQDRWSGQFPVRWHIIKDVPNIRLRHILLGNNNNKPVTHSRDSQEVSLKQGIEVLRICKDYDASTSLLDDFDFYNEREKTWKERKAKQQASSTAGVAHSLADSIHEVSNSFAQGLKLAESRDLE